MKCYKYMQSKCFMLLIRLKHRTFTVNLCIYMHSGNQVTWTVVTWGLIYKG